LTSKLKRPLRGAVQRYQIDRGCGKNCESGSPASAVAPTLEASRVPDEPLSVARAAKSSFAGRPSAAL
jgi:hypothetical protein